MPRLSTCLFHYYRFSKLPTSIYIVSCTMMNNIHACFFAYACVAPRPGLWGPEVKTFHVFLIQKLLQTCQFSEGSHQVNLGQYTRTMFASYIGLPVYYTGQKPINSPCISVNLRHSEEPWDNCISALLSCLHGIVTWRIHGVLSGRYGFRFCECPQNPLFSHPNYSVLHNNWRSKTLRSKTPQGAVITRDCCQYLEVVLKIVVSGIRSLETNYDHRLSVIDDRRDPGMNEIFCAYCVLNFSYKLV